MDPTAEGAHLKAPVTSTGEVMSGGGGREVVQPRIDKNLPALDIDAINAKLGDDPHSGIEDVANYTPEQFDNLSVTPSAKSPDISHTSASTEDPRVAEARARVAAGDPKPADLKLIQEHDSEARSKQNLKEAYSAVAGGTASEDQRKMVEEDTNKREVDRVAGRKAEIAATRAKRKGDGTFDDPADETKYKDDVKQQQEWADLTRRAAAGETLSDEDKAKLEEGDKVFKEEEPDEVVEDSESARIEKLQAELDATVEAMLAEKDPDKRTALLDRLASQRVEVQGLKRSVEDADRDKRVIREALSGKRDGSLVSDEKRAKNERVAQILDSMLADAAELMAISRQLEVLDKQKKELVKKINSEKKRLGHSSTPMDKFVQVREIVPMYRQLNAMDEQSANIAEAGYNYADRYYKNLSAVRRSLRTSGIVVGIMETVALHSLRYTADIQKYSKRATRTLFG